MMSPHRTISHRRWRLVQLHGTAARLVGQPMSDARQATWIATRSVIAEAYEQHGACRDLWRFAAIRLSEVATHYRQSLAPGLRTQADAWTELLDEVDHVRARIKEARAIAAPPLAGAEKVDRALREVDRVMRDWLRQHRPLASPRTRGRRDLTSPFIGILAALAHELEGLSGREDYKLLARFADSIFPSLPFKKDDHSLRTAISRRRSKISGTNDLKTLTAGLRALRRRRHTKAPP